MPREFIRQKGTGKVLRESKGRSETVRQNEERVTTENEHSPPEHLVMQNGKLVSHGPPTKNDKNAFPVESGQLGRIDNA